MSSNIECVLDNQTDAASNSWLVTLDCPTRYLRHQPHVQADDDRRDAVSHHVDEALNQRSHLCLDGDEDMLGQLTPDGVLSLADAHT